jgi:tetratricopeptide (TPR) repeat protein
MKKKLAPSRPQPAQIQAIERCLERGDLDGADERLLRLQAAFPDFKPLCRLAFEIAWEGGRIARAAAAAWDWCEASPNSAAAFNALRNASRGRYPYLFLHAAERAGALGEPVPDEDLRKVRNLFKDSLDERDGLRLDLSRVFMGAGRNGDARPLIETLDHPAARNNFAQILFAEGEIGRAAEIFESVLAENPADHFALFRLATLRLWLSGKTRAADLNERLLAGTPADPEELCRQLESALLFGQPARADGIYRLAPDLPWYDESEKYAPESLDAMHYLGAMAAWRMGDHHETIRRIKAACEDNDEFDDEYDDIGGQCLIASVNGDTPDWTLGALSQWWPLSRILSLRPKLLDSDDALFENWQVPMPHCDYLVAVMASGGSDARVLALAALRYLTGRGGELREEAKQALFELLRLPCGPDKVRSELHAMMADDDLLDGKTSIEMFVGGKLTEIRPLTITIREGPADVETVLDAADLERYERALGHVADGDLPRALKLLEDLLSRYPDYPRILTAAAMLRQGNGQTYERWAPLARRAAEIAPDYFFSRTGMARLLAAENKIEEAREFLLPLLEREEMHRSEWRSLIGAQIAIAQAEGDFPAVARLRAMLRNFDRSSE